MKSKILLLILIFVLLLSCSCSSDKTISVNLKSGETVQLLASDIYKKLGEDAEIEWLSSDESVVTVSDGKITYVREGTATVTAKGTSKNGKKTYETSFSVNCLNANGSVKLDVYTVFLDNDGDTYTVNATLSDKNDSIKKWTSSDESIATVVDGKITRLAPGRAKVTVETALGYKAVCSVMCDSVVLKLGDIEITDSMYGYWLASYKTQIVEYSIGYDDPSVWEMVVDDKGTTFADLFLTDVNDTVNQMLKAVYIYYENNDVVSKEITDEVDAQMNSAISSCGNEEGLNLVLSNFYFDKDHLKKVFEIEEITNQTYMGLFGENGTNVIEDKEINKYFDDNYAKAQHVFFDLLYKTDSSGEYVNLSEDEITQKTALSNEVWEKIQNKTLKYDDAIKQYSDDLEENDAGFVFTDGDYVKEFTSVVFEMEIGEIRKVQTEFGVHIIRKLALAGTDLSDDIKTEITDILQNNEFDKILSSYNLEIEENSNLADNDNYDISNIPLFSEYF